MTETKFTPGPWEYVKLSHGSVYIRSLRHGVDGYLADVFLSRPGECKANARLIAAAPDLLEALQQCAESMRDAFPDFDHFERPAYKAAVYAIAKATGGEEREKGDD